MNPFGLFLLLGFAAAYLTFRFEYRRKEAEGVIHPFKGPKQIVHPLLWALLGFVAGAKLVYWWLHRHQYIGTPQDFIFSLRGNLVAGLLAPIVAGLIGKRQSPRGHAAEVMHPY